MDFTVQLLVGFRDVRRESIQLGLGLTVQVLGVLKLPQGSLLLQVLTQTSGREAETTNRARRFDLTDLSLLDHVVLLQLDLKVFQCRIGGHELLVLLDFVSLTKQMQ